MRVRDHVALSVAAATLLHSRGGRRVLIGAAASVLLDVDHYLYYCLRYRRLDPRAAVRFFNQPDSPHAAATRCLHTALPLMALFLVAARWRPALPVALGAAAHVALDAQHEARMELARLEALRRDDYTCGRCGRRDAGIGTHILRQPLLLPSYAAENLTTLCQSCHGAAHASEVCYL